MEYPSRVSFSGVSIESDSLTGKIDEPLFSRNRVYLWSILLVIYEKMF